MRAAERRLGLAEALAGRIREWRNPDRVDMQAQPKPAPPWILRTDTAYSGHFLTIISIGPKNGVEAVEAACPEALARGACSADVVLNILARH